MVLFEALHGQRPFLGDDVPAILAAIEAGALSRPARKDLPPPAVSTVIRRALDRDPARRFPDMPALLTSLRLARRSQRLPSVRAMAAWTMAVTLAGGLGLLAYGGPRDEPEAASAAKSEVTVLDATTMRSLAALTTIGRAEPEPSPYGDRLRCSDDATVCEIDRELAARLAGLPAAEFVDRAKVMPSVQHGVARGAKFYGIKAGSTLSLLGVRNGDLMLAVDGTLVAATDFVPTLQRLLTTGGTLRFMRKDQTYERRYAPR